MFRGWPCARGLAGLSAYIFISPYFAGDEYIRGDSDGIRKSMRSIHSSMGPKNFSSAGPRCTINLFADGKRQEEGQ